MRTYGLMECLYSGFDGLDVAFDAALPRAALDTLEAAKDEAQAAMAPARAAVGTVDCLVAETGAPGGYRYRFSTGDDGETWFIKAKPAPQSAGYWGVRVSVNSLALALHGLDAIHKRLYDRLAAMGAEVKGEAVGRADFAADFRAPGFAIDPARFVAHSHSTKRDEVDDTLPSTAWQGRRVSSVTIGKMPGRQVIVYDKRLEAVQKRKLHWFDIWGVDRAERVPVWRVEVRAGKRCLKDIWRVTTVADLKATFADFVAHTFKAVRYLDAYNIDSNVTRAAVDPFWKEAARVMEAALRDRGITESGVVPGKVITGRRSIVRDMYLGLITGLSASFAAVNRLEGKAAEAVYQDIAAAIRAAINESPQEFHRKVRRARNRMVLMEDAHDGMQGVGHSPPMGRAVQEGIVSEPSA
jgi:hypothetical protein